MKKPTMYTKTFSGAAAVQVKSELEQFLDLIVSNNITSYLEIGTARGDTFHEVMINMPIGSRGVTVDLPESFWGLKGSQDQLINAHKDLQEKGYTTEAIFGSSRDIDIVNKANGLGSYDVIFIDGDHTYEGVKADWLNYMPHAVKFVVFHDIVDTMRPNRKGEKIDVPIFWEELKQKYNTLEFVGENSTMGIGVVIL